MAQAISGLNESAPFTQTLADSDVQLPAWLQQATRGLAGQANTVAGQAYQPYQAPTGVETYGQDTGQLAGFSPLQTQSFQNIQANQGNYQPYINNASQTAPQAVGSYMSPYTDSVVNRIAQLGQRNLSENLLPQVNSTFTGAGQFGSDRNADFTNRALRDTQDSVLGQQSSALQSGFQNAMTNSMADMTRQASLGQTVQQLGFQDASMLGTAGGQQQAQTQQNMNLANQDWQNQNNYQKQNIDWLSGVIRGLPSQQSTYQSTTQLPTASSTISPLAAAAQGFLGARTLASTSPSTTGVAQPGR